MDFDGWNSKRFIDGYEKELTGIVGIVGESMEHEISNSSADFKDLHFEFEKVSQVKYGNS